MDDNEERGSTASTVSGLYTHIIKVTNITYAIKFIFNVSSYFIFLQSPAPICMFYFAHPFGIASPQSKQKSKPIQSHNLAVSSLQSTSIERVGELSFTSNQTLGTHKGGILGRNTYTPWPIETWRRDHNILPPLVQVLASQMGEFIYGIVCEYTYIKKKSKLINFQ